jgi:hypothetical protein
MSELVDVEVVRARMTYVHDDTRSLSVCFEEIIEAVQDERDGVIRVERGDKVSCVEGRALWVRPTVGSS